MGRQLPHSAVLAGIVDPWASIEQPVALLVLVVDNASRRSIDRRIGVLCMPVSAQLIGGPLHHNPILPQVGSQVFIGTSNFVASFLEDAVLFSSVVELMLQIVYSSLGSSKSLSHVVELLIVSSHQLVVASDHLISQRLQLQDALIGLVQQSL